MMLTGLVVAAVLSGVIGAVTGLLALRRSRRAVDDCLDLLTRQAVIGAGGIDGKAIRDVAVYRYGEPPENAGSREAPGSFSAAFLNSMGDGVVLTALGGRSGSRTYARAVRAGRGVEPLTPEEEKAVRAARLGAGPDLAPSWGGARHAASGPRSARRGAAGAR